MSTENINYDDHNDHDVKDFFRLLTTFIPQKSVDGAMYLIDEWEKHSQTSQYYEKAHERWSAMDRLAEKVFGRTELNLDLINKLICKSIPEAFSTFPVWKAETIRVAGRDISPSELFHDPFTCLLAWCGLCGIHNQRIVPGYLTNMKSQYIYEGHLGPMANIGHLFSKPAWRALLVSEIAKQYNLNARIGIEILNKIKSSQDELNTLVYLLKKVIAWGQNKFNEQYTCMSNADSFYTQCLYSYNPGIIEQQVRSITSGAVIPIEKHGGKLSGKHSARVDYFEKGILGPGAENIKIIYQWDSDTTAIKLSEEQKKAEEEGRGQEHKNDAINILCKYLTRPNIELSEGSFTGPWHWKNYFTLVSDQRVAFSGRNKVLKQINHGIWINHQDKLYLVNWLKEQAKSKELTYEQKQYLQENLPNAKHLHDVTKLLYQVEKKRIIKPYGETISQPQAYATEIVEELLQRGSLLLK